MPAISGSLCIFMSETFRYIETSSKRLAYTAVLALGAMTLSSCGEKSDPPGPGYDVSWPQCVSSESAQSKPLPKAHSFSIVGVNYRKPGQFNSCFDDQIQWARRSAGGTSRPKVDLYVNAANAGKLAAATWPKTGRSPYYGECRGNDDKACAYEKGAEYAAQDIAFLKDHLRKHDRPMIWIDIEPDNSWECNDGLMRLCNKPASIHVAKGAHDRNVATIQGMAQTFKDSGYKIGIYTSYDNWDMIVDGQDKATSLKGLPVWITGLPPNKTGQRTKENAIENCATQIGALGKVIISQYVVGTSSATGEQDVNVICSEVTPTPSPKR